MLIRPAITVDAPAVRDVYAHHVRHGVGTFEEEPPGVAEMRARMAVGQWWVADVVDEGIVGYASYRPYNARSGYRHTVENSVFVRPDAVGRGIGSLLLASVVHHATAAGLRRMVAVIGGSDNVPSIALHERHGFVRTGLLGGVGVKFGETLDVVLMQRPLAPDP